MPYFMRFFSIFWPDGCKITSHKPWFLCLNGQVQLLRMHHPAAIFGFKTLILFRIIINHLCFGGFLLLLFFLDRHLLSLKVLLHLLRITLNIFYHSNLPFFFTIFLFSFYYPPSLPVWASIIVGGFVFIWLTVIELAQIFRIIVVWR